MNMLFDSIIFIQLFETCLNVNPPATVPFPTKANKQESNTKSINTLRNFKLKEDVSIFTKKQISFYAVKETDLVINEKEKEGHILIQQITRFN